MSDTTTLFIVKGTFLLLIAASALTWAIVISKALQHWRLSKQTAQFLRRFKGLSGFPTLETFASLQGPVARVAQAGLETWLGSDKDSEGAEVALDVRRDLLERRLSQQLQRERRAAEGGLPVLASVGSSAPFVGLFGTVLGIVHALQRISGAGSASLDVVAGPIGEALIATAIGIAVAVPAVLSYNFFLRRLKTLTAELEDFGNSFVASAIKTFVHLAPADAPEGDAALSVGQEVRA
jgi:biopolymer transport protein ExbB